MTYQALVRVFLLENSRLSVALFKLLELTTTRHRITFQINFTKTSDYIYDTSMPK